MRECRPRPALSIVRRLEAALRVARGVVASRPTAARRLFVVRRGRRPWPIVRRAAWGQGRGRRLSGRLSPVARRGYRPRPYRPIVRRAASSVARGEGRDRRSLSRKRTVRCGNVVRGRLRQSSVALKQRCAWRRARPSLSAYRPPVAIGPSRDAPLHRPADRDRPSGRLSAGERPFVSRPSASRPSRCRRPRPSRLNAHASFIAENDGRGRPARSPVAIGPSRDADIDRGRPAQSPAVL